MMADYCLTLKRDFVDKKHSPKPKKLKFMSSDIA